jgi:PAS domain S-box-containing protein
MNHLPSLLIVDDNSLNLNYLKAVVRGLNVEVIAANSGLLALERSHDVELALAIIDIHMPEMNGYELAVKLNENRKNNLIPVIFLTANFSNEADVLKGYEKGAVDYIFKPINNHILLSKIKVFVDLFKQKKLIEEDKLLLKEYTNELIKINHEKKESEKKYRNYINKAPDGVFVLDENGRFIEVNQAACKITGYSENELLKLMVLNFFKEEDTRFFFKQLQSLSHSKVIKRELEFICKDGLCIWISIDLVRLNNSRFLCFAKDITQRVELKNSLIRKQLEIEQQNSDLKLANSAAKEAIKLYDFSPSGYFTINNEGKIIRLNLCAAKLLKKGRNELINKFLNSFLSNKSKEIFDDFLNSIFNYKIQKSCEIEMSFSEKTNLYLHFEGIISDNNDLCLISATDITSRYLTEKKLFENEKQYRQLINTANEGILVVQNGFCKFVNPALAEIIGCKEEELLSVPILNFVHPDYLKRVKANNHKTIVNNAKQPIYQIEILKKDNSIKWVDVSGVKTEWKDKPAVLYFISDITDRKLAEKDKNAFEQLQLLTEYAEKAKEAERKAIARELHDDLGQALTAVKIDLALVNKNSKEANTISKINKVSELVGESIKTVQRITSQLRPQILDDLGILAAIEWYTTEFSERNNIDITLFLNSDLVVSNNTSLVVFRILQESFTNISRHSKAKNVEVVFDLKGNYLYLKICDDGIGINLEQIYSKQSFGIMGMKERVNLLNGSFDIYSNVTKNGTTVEIFLPY